MPSPMLSDMAVAMSASLSEGINSAMDSSFTLSDAPTSPLSPARSVSPPLDEYYLEQSQSRLLDRLTPSSSQSDFSSSQRSDSDGNPAPKRRKLNNGMPRETFHVDLETPSEEQHAKQEPHLAKLKKALATKRKIVVIAGAGISVSAGIPDFRSSTGLFKSLKAEHNLKGSGKHLFDAAVYKDDTSTSSFHEMVRSMSTLTKSAKPTPFHHLLGRLAHENRLLRLYTQNVDGLDTSIEPLKTEVPLPKKGPWPKTIQLHGSLDKMNCSKCHRVSEFNPEFFQESSPKECKQCKDFDDARSAAGKRSHGIGRVRPRMVLYNEHNPDDEAIGAVTKADLRTRPDAVIVVGTSLKIPGVRRIVREMCGIVRDRRDGLTVWLNSDPPPSEKFFENCWDLVIKGTADEIAQKASLGKFDDPEVIVDFVSEDSAAQAKASSQAEVVLQTPSKTTQPKVEGTYPTPVMSPRPPVEQHKTLKLNMPKQPAPPKGQIKMPKSVPSKKASNAKMAPKMSNKPAKPRAKKTAPKEQGAPISRFAKSTKAGLQKNPDSLAISKENDLEHLSLSKKRQSPDAETPQTPSKRSISTQGPIELSAGDPKVNVSPSKFPNLTAEYLK